MKLIKLFASAATLAALLPSYSQASDYSFNIIELSATQLSVTGTFPGYGPFSGTITNPAGDGWDILNGGNNGIVNGGQYLTDPTYGLYFDYFGIVNWLEPDSNPANPTYNTFIFGYEPSGGHAEHIYVTSDVQNPPGLTAGCGLGGQSACPILLNGQTEYDIPLIDNYDSLTIIGAMDVTFTDQDDISATPLPSTWLMLLSGFVGLGFFAYRGTKKKASALAVA